MAEHGSNGVELESTCKWAYQACFTAASGLTAKHATRLTTDSHTGPEDSLLTLP